MSRSGASMDWDTLTKLDKKGRLPRTGDAPLGIKLTPAPKGAKILYLDIECSPNIADVWGLWDQNVGLSQLKRASRIMGFSYRWNSHVKAKWIGEDTASQFAILAAAHRLYDEADVVVTYNGNSYDNKVLNAEWVKKGFEPPSPYKSLDLYRIVAKHFKFPSKKLAYVAQVLIGDTKVSHAGHDLWNACLDPHIDEKTRSAAWRVMSRYCRQDVDLLVPLHEKLLPWLGDTVNIAYLNDQLEGCPKCGSGKLQKRGFFHTATRSYQRFKCLACGGWTRGSKCVDSFAQRAA